MDRSRGQKSRDKNKATPSQVPKNMKSDGIDEEFFQKLADRANLEGRLEV